MNDDYMLRKWSFAFLAMADSYILALLFVTGNRRSSAKFPEIGGFSIQRSAQSSGFKCR
jgi:hypothetical protein